MRACSGPLFPTTIERTIAVTAVARANEMDLVRMDVRKKSLPRPSTLLSLHCLSSLLDGFAAGGGSESSQASMTGLKVGAGRVGNCRRLNPRIEGPGVLCYARTAGGGVERIALSAVMLRMSDLFGARGRDCEQRSLFRRLSRLSRPKYQQIGGWPRDPIQGMQQHALSDGSWYQLRGMPHLFMTLQVRN